MPIDTTVIEGFESMTAEQKVEALLKVEVPEKIDLSGYVKKDLFDKTASELAEAKKTIKGKMSEDEAAKAQADADRKALRTSTPNCFVNPPFPSIPPDISLCRAMTRSWPVRRRRLCLMAIWRRSLRTSRKPTLPMRRSCGLIWSSRTLSLTVLVVEVRRRTRPLSLPRSWESSVRTPSKMQTKV